MPKRYQNEANIDAQNNIADAEHQPLQAKKEGEGVSSAESDEAHGARRGDITKQVVWTK